MSGRNVKVALIGSGNHAQENLIPAIREVEGMEICTIQSRNKSRATALAERYGIPRILSEQDQNITVWDIDCDAVIVSATPEIHEGYLMEAIRHKRHVFVEKPPASNLESMQEIAIALELPGAPVVQFGFNFRYADCYEYIREAKTDNRTIRYMRIKSFAAKPDQAMWQYKDVLTSSLYAVHIHAIEMLCHAMGVLKGSTYGVIWVDSRKYVLVITATFENGGMGVLELSNASNRFEFDIECIDSRRNVFRCDGFNHVELFGPSFDTQTMFKPKSYMQYDTPFLRGGYGKTGYSSQFEYFRDRIIKKQMDTYSIQSCIDAYKIIDGVTSNE